MRTIEQLLNQLGDQRITIRLENEGLVVNAPKGAMTQELATEIRLRKPDLIQFLSVMAQLRQPIPTAPQGETLRASLPQQRLWFIEQLAGAEPSASGQYNLYAALKLTGTVNLSAFRRAIQQLGERHLTLRMRFLDKEGNPVPVVDPPEVLTLAVEDLSQAPSQALWDGLYQETRFPFRLDQDCLCRFRIFRIQAEEHVLMVNMHHIISDGWSMGLLVQDLMALYAEQAHGIQAILTPLTISYLDYAYWQHSPAFEEQLAAQLDWWVENLRGLPQVHQVPTDMVRPPVNAHRGSQVNHLIEPEVLQALEGLAKDWGASLYMLLLAAFKVLISRYSRMQDVAIGAVIANRNRTELEPLIGFFVNTLVLRSQVDSQQPFEAFLAQVKRHTLECFARQDVPFDKVVDAVKPERALNHAPLVQIMFSQQNAPMHSLSFPGLSLEPLNLAPQTAKFDLTLDTLVASEGLRTAWDFNSDLFHTSTIERMARHYAHLLRAIAKAPGTQIGEFTLADPDERNLVVTQWNQTMIPFPNTVPVHHHFAYWAERQPNHSAVVSDDGDQTLTYGQLNQQANQLAWMLKERGIRPEDRVALYFDRSPIMVVAILGALKAGAIYVPLDPNYPPDRVAFMLQDCEAKAILCAGTPPPPSSLPILDLAILTLNTFPTRDPATGIFPDQAAYMIYTSGSTGKPKAAVNTHRGLSNHALWQQRQFPLGEDDRIAMKTPFSFDVSVLETFWALVSGATLVLVKPGMHGDPFYLRDFIQKHRITGLHFVGSMLKAFLDSLSEPVFHSSLKYLRSGGEAWPASLRPQVFARWHGPNGPLVTNNGYGPSETAINVTHFSAPGEPLAEEPPIGKPLPNNHVYVVDSHLRPTPLGIPGELMVGGAHLGRGYFRRPGLTAASFVPNPFAQTPGQRLYRTGDLVRWLPEGNLRFMGRLDSQVKLRGLRIELGEIEAALARMPSVSQAVVVLGQAMSGEKHLIAYAQLHAQADAAALLSNWKNPLASSLPAYMVPSQLRILEALPQLPNGKVDRKNLQSRILEPVDKIPGTQHVPPRTHEERAIAEIWSEVLKVPTPGVFDHFFELGGHSLLATQVISRIHSRMGFQVPLAQLFASPTIAKLAEWMAQRTPSAVLQHHNLAPGQERPLTSSQQRLWFLEQLNANEQSPSGIYNISSNWKIQGHLEVDLLQTALQKLCMRHETLRSQFTTHQGLPHLVVTEHSLCQLETLNLQNSSEKEIRELLNLESKRGFFLDREPLLRLKVLQLNADQAILCITIHHIIADGWSMGILIRELMALYLELSTGIAARLPRLEVQYPDFAFWQQLPERKAEYQEKLAWWKDWLKGVPPVHQLPTDRPRHADMAHDGALFEHSLDVDLTAQLRALALTTGTTLYMVLLAAFKTLCYRFSQEEDVAIGTPVANRALPALEHLIGLFVNTVVLRSSLDPAVSFTQFLASLKENVLESFARQEVPFEQIVDAVKPERNLGQTPLFQIMFAMQNAPFDVPTPPGFKVEPLPALSTTAKFDITLNLVPKDGGLLCAWEYKKALYDGETLRLLAQSFERLLRGIVAQPQTRLHALPLLTSEEEKRLLITWNQAKPAFNDHQWAHRHFEATAATHPDQIALVCHREIHCMTYAQMNQRANQLAWLLIEYGVSSDDCVAVCMDRGFDLPVTLLAILKAGAAFVPLDPSHPTTRLTYMLEDLKPKLLIRDSSRDDLDFPATLTLPSCIQQTYPVHNPNLPTHPLQAAFLIYTSGSTGQPKASINTHLGFANFLEWCRREFPLGSEDRLVFKTPISFDVSLLEIFWGLSGGATLVICRPGCHGDPSYLQPWIMRQQITVIHFVGSLLKALLEYRHDFPFHHRLRWFFTGGEAFPPEVLARFSEFFSGLSGPLLIENNYGPSEAAITITHHRIEPGRTTQDLPIGKPLPNASVYVADRFLNPVPNRVAGELLLAGLNLGRCYHQRSRLTADKFRPNPFSNLPGDRLYRTGDLGRWMPQGHLEFLGRIDHQVKLRGLRIELGEIEAALRQDPRIQFTTVVMGKTGKGENLLVAYYQAEPGHVEDLEEQLRAQLRQSLPAYMVPSLFVAMEVWPLMPNGKIHRRQLMDLTHLPDAQRSQQELVAPRNDIEAQLAEIWKEILGIDQVSVMDSFFEIGGHSLLATQVLSRIHAAFPEKVSLRFLFEKTSIAEIAEGIAQIRTVTQEKHPPSSDSGREDFEF